MQYSPLKLAARYGLSGVLRDPLTMGAGALTVAGSAISAGATLAGGNAAQASANFTAGQLEQNATQERAMAQRRMFDRQNATNAVIATSRTRAAASGVDPGAGSALTNEEDLAKRGEYQSLMEYYGGDNQATGLQNQAAGVRFEGDMKKQGAQLTALATLASGAGKTLGMGAQYYYPTPRGLAR